MDKFDFQFAENGDPVQELDLLLLITLEVDFYYCELYLCGQ